MLQDIRRVVIIVARCERERKIRRGMNKDREQKRAEEKRRITKRIQKQRKRERSNGNKGR
jgi:hypothetical protein